MKEFIEHIKGFWLVYGLLAAASVWLATIDSKTFETPEQRVEHEYHIQNALTPKDQWRKFLRDSMDKENAKKSRARRDSLWIEMNKTLKHQDSINRLNADQLYQIKEELKHENN